MAKHTKLTRKEKSELWVLLEQFRAGGAAHPFWNVNINRYIELLDRYLIEESLINAKEKGEPEKAT